MEVNQQHNYFVGVKPLEKTQRPVRPLTNSTQNLLSGLKETLI